MPIFSQQKYNNYVPQYVGAPLDEYLMASGAVQDRFNKVQEGYSLIGELAETLEASPLEGDQSQKSQLVDSVRKSINDAAQRGNFDMMQNEMRGLAKLYARQAAPIKENLSRFKAAETAIQESKLPQSHRNFLISNLRSKPGLTYNQYGQPEYLQPDQFAENVELRDVYEKFINDYKSDKHPGGVHAVMGGNGVVEYYSNTTNELVDADEVRAGLQTTAFYDPKVQQFILQDARANGVDIKNGQDFINYATPLMEAFVQKAAFSKQDMDFKLGHADEARKDDLGAGFTFPINWGVPARQGTATPSDLRKTLTGLDEQRLIKNDEFGRFLKQNAVDPLTGKSADGTDFSEEVALYNEQLDAIDADKWELQETEAQAKKDANLPASWTPPQKVLDKAQAEYDSYFNAPQGSAASIAAASDPEGQKRRAQDAYNKVIDTSNDPSLKAYRDALKKNAKDRTDVRGVTTFGKSTRAEMDVIGNRLLAGDWGFIKGKDVATGDEIADLKEYGTAVENIGWTADNGQLQLVYKTGEMDKNTFIPSNKKVSITAPPELVTELVKRKLVDPLDLDISRQIGPKGGRVQIGNLQAEVEIKRAAETGSANVVVVLNNGKKRVAFPSQGSAIKFLNNLSKNINGN